MKIFIIILAVLVLWSLWGYFSANVEQTEYSVLEKKDGYEIRLYPKHLVAQTTVAGPYRDALNEGFRIVAGYIFGGNVKKESIAMTAPVVERPTSNTSEKIAMTAPVVTTTEGESHVISFGMPRSYTKETLPTPNDSRVQIVEIPEKKMAVLRFSWTRATSNMERQKAKLKALLVRDGVETIGDAFYAGYNAPWTPPWMTRNEILIEMK